MVTRTRIQSIDREIELMLGGGLSGAERSRMFGQWAGEQINQARSINRAILKRDPVYTVSVDGREGADLNSVKPHGGVIIAEFQGVITQALEYILTQLQMHSPVLTGHYAKSHELFADNVHVEIPSQAPPATEYVFLNVQPYARKIERGQSSQSPEGVYQAIPKLARSRFGNVAKISFTYRSAAGFESLNQWADRTGLGRQIRSSSRRAEWLRRQPAIIVTPL